MSAPRFTEAVVVAALGSALAGVSYHALIYLLPVSDALRLVIAITGLGYTLWLAARAPARSGRVFVSALWGVGTLCTLVLDPPILLHLLTQLAFFWLMRVLCHHRGVLHGATESRKDGAAVGY